MPKRSSSARRTSTGGSAGPSGWANRSAESSSRSSSSWPSAASCERGVLVLPQRAAGLGEQPGDGDDGLAQPAQPVVGAVAGGDRLADSIASIRPPPISSARESTATVFTGAARATPWSWNDSRNSHVAGVQVAHQVERRRRRAVGRVVGGEEPRPGARRGSGDSEATPGVSINVVRAQRGDGQSTTRWSTSSAAARPEVDDQRPVAGGPPAAARRRAVAGEHRDRDGAVPVAVPGDDPGALPASVGAICSPTSALSSVDLPALTLPATASRRARRAGRDGAQPPLRRRARSR